MFLRFFVCESKKGLIKWRRFCPKSTNVKRKHFWLNLLDVLHFGKGLICGVRTMNPKDTPRSQQFHQAHRIFRMANRWIYTHSICWIEYSSLYSLFHIVQRFFEMWFPNERVLRNRKIGPRSVLVHRFWSSWKRNSGCSLKWRVWRVKGVLTIFFSKRSTIIIRFPP